MSVNNSSMDRERPLNPQEWEQRQQEVVQVGQGLENKSSSENSKEPDNLTNTYYTHLPLEAVFGFSLFSNTNKLKEAIMDYDDLVSRLVEKGMVTEVNGIPAENLTSDMAEILANFRIQFGELVEASVLNGGVEVRQRAMQELTPKKALNRRRYLKDVSIDIKDITLDPSQEAVIRSMLFGYDTYVKYLDEAGLIKRDEIHNGFKFSENVGNEIAGQIMNFSVVAADVVEPYVEGRQQNKARRELVLNLFSITEARKRLGKTTETWEEHVDRIGGLTSSLDELKKILDSK